MNTTYDLTVRQYLKERENLEKPLREFEMATRCYFDLEYFKNLFLTGKFFNASKYAKAFADTLNQNDNQILIEVHKQNFFSLLARKQVSMASKLLAEDLVPIFPQDNRDQRYQEYALLCVEWERSEKIKEWTLNRKDILVHSYEKILAPAIKNSSFAAKIELPSQIPSLSGLFSKPEEEKPIEPKQSDNGLKKEEPLEEPMEIIADERPTTLPTSYLSEVKWGTYTPSVVAFHPIDDKLLLVGSTSSKGNKLTLLNSITGEVLSQKSISNPPQLIVWESKDLRFVLLLKESKIFNVYSAKDNKLTFLYSSKESTPAHILPITCAVTDTLGEDNSRSVILTGSMDGFCKIWDSQTDECLYNLLPGDNQ